MAELMVSGTRVYYRELGDGPRVVLLHSGGSSSAQWRRVCERLAARWRAVTLDFHGYGGTGPWPGAAGARTHEAEGRLVRAVIDHTGEGPVHVVGHSYGGAVALRIAIACGGAVQSLVLIEPQNWAMLLHGGERDLWEQVCGQARRFIALVEAGRVADAWCYFFDTNNGDGAWDRLTEDARGRMVALTETGVSTYHANLNDATTPTECRAVDVPVLVLIGSETVSPYRRMAEIIASHMNQARIEVVPGAGHMSPLTHPDAVAAAIAKHLEARAP